MEIVELIEAKGLRYIQKSSDEIAIVCPNEAAHGGGKDAKPSFNINTERLVAHCFACGFSLTGEKLINWLTGGSMEDTQFKAMAIKAKIRQMEERSATQTSEARQVMIPPGKPWEEDGFRGISIETYHSLGAVKCERGFYENRLVFPIYVGGELIGVDARALGGQEPKYLRNKGCTCKTDWLFPYDKVKDMKPSYVIIAEGIFHAVNAVDKGFPALCFFGSNNFSRTKLRMLMALNVDEVVYFRDNDKAGLKAEQEICGQIIDWLPMTSAYTKHIAEDKDLGDLTKEEIEYAIQHRSKPVIPSCLPDSKPTFGDRCRERKCPFKDERGRCQNVIW